MTPAMLLGDGVTSMVDGGSAGADNIDALVRVAQTAPNRVRIFLNVARTGVTAGGELMDIAAADVPAAQRAMAQHREWIVASRRGSRRRGPANGISRRCGAPAKSPARCR
jgi:predicted amidohydrolase